MIPFASQRGGGQDLATHLQNTYDNELMEVVEVRGSVARDLHGAFKEWEVQAETLTRCRKYLYSMSINPDPAQGEITREQYFDYIARAEAALDLADQPRAIVFHTKHGREHCHVVWSRIDAEHQKAVHIAFDREKLMRVTRDFAKEHFLDLPPGYEKSRGKGQDTLYERAQQNATGLSKADHKAQVTEAWRHSDDARSFVQALSEKGYILATGKRPYVLVDLYGGMHALSKLIDDKAVKTKDIRAYLEKDFPEDSLPSVEEAEALAAKHRKLLERPAAEERLALKLAELKHAQQLRRLAVEQQAGLLNEQHRKDRERLMLAQQQECRALMRRQAGEIGAIKSRRYETRATGLAGFLGKVTGIAAVHRAVHRYQDGKLLEAQRRARADLTKHQESEKKALAVRQAVQDKEMDRQTRALQRLEKREVDSLKRDELRDQRKRDRGPENEMPALLLPPQPEKSGWVPDVANAFEKASVMSGKPVPDVREEFREAAGDWDRSQSGGDDQGHDLQQGPDEPQRDR